MLSRIIHPLLRVISQGNEDLSSAAMNTICCLALSLADDFIVFIPVIKKTLIALKTHSAMFDQIVTKMLNGDPLPTHLNLYKDYDSHMPHFDVPDVDTPFKKLPVNQAALKAAWDSSQRNNTKEDWQEWIARLSKELLKQSPSHAIRACAGLASDYHPLAKDLFNSSFASCWSELYSQHQEE